MKLTKQTIGRLSNYQPADYIKDLELLGLEETWLRICEFVTDENNRIPEFLDVNNFGELYEKGLAIQDKNSKKKSGQYFTPDDVAKVMAQWLDACDGENVCDVGCGTGNLILTYLDTIGEKRAKNLLLSGKLYLYDADLVALQICRAAITFKYGKEAAENVNVICADFLDASLKLPDNAKVIANPPYAEIKEVKDTWEKTDVLSSKDFYAVFMEKVIKQAKSVVIITPFTFVSGAKFGALRKEMCRQGNGFILSFDNVPANIFCGRKQGVFNSNTANSVRAAITVFHKSAKKKGFLISPLIRFKTEERGRLLKCDVLQNTLPETYQCVKGTDPFYKVPKDLTDVYDIWVEKSKFVAGDFITGEENAFFLDMPNTCRYYTVAGKEKLNRKGSYSFYANNPEQYYFLYCVINSSFAYFWWRIYDGAITYSQDLFRRLPLPYNLLTAEDHEFFKKTALKMMQEEKNYIIKKKNAGTVQENIRFPENYREMINKRILQILGLPGEKCEALLRIHSNSFFEGKDL